MGEEVIDLATIEKKENISNSEYILSIIEICLNGSKYGLTHEHSTKEFWKEVDANKRLNNILKKFKTETLRKYWRTIRDINDYDNVIKVIKDNASCIDKPCYKLLPLIKAIESCVKKAKGKNFEKYLTPIKANSVPAKDKSINSNEKLLNKKRKKDEIEEDIEAIQTIKIKKENIISVESKQEEKEITLDDIINIFMNEFKEYSKEEIYQILYKTSCNVKKAYLNLSNPDKYDYMLFENTDDYIIQNLRNKPYYKQLIESKGEENVKEREEFLNLNRE